MSAGPDQIAPAAPAEPARARGEAAGGHAQFTLDRDGNVASWSSGAERLLGGPASVIVGRHFSDLYSPMAAAAGTPQDVLRRALAAGCCDDEGPFQRQDGTLFQAAATVAALVDAARQPLGYCVSLRAGGREQASEARYRVLVEHVQVGIVLADAQSYYIDANPSACQLLGYTRDELIGLHAADIVVPGEVAQISPALSEINGHCTHEREWQFRRKDGSVFSAAVVATRMPDGSLLGTIRDITALKEREREIDRLTRLYAALSQVNQAIVWSRTRAELFDKVCRVLVEHGGFDLAWIGWHDPATRRLTPLAQCGGPPDFLRSTIVYADDRPEGRGPSGRAFRSGLPHVSNDLLHDPGVQVWQADLTRRGFQAAASFPILDQGAIRGTLTVFAHERDYFHDKEVALLAEAATDVSFALDNFARDDARREADRVLLSEKLFSDTMIDAMPGILYFYDGEGRFLRWNRNFEQASGYSAAEIRGMHPRQFFAGEDRQRVEQRIAEVFVRGEAAVEAAFVAKDGRATPYFFTGRRVPFDGKTCLIGVGIDLSDRRQAEARLAESERKYRELVEHANSVILRWSADGRITFLNEFGQRLFGYSAAEIVGRHVTGTIVPSIESGGRDLGKLMEEICANPEAFEQNINENIRRDGERIWIAWTNRIVRDPQGAVAEILSIGTDITHRRLAEAEREKRHRAEAADRIKSAFLATMSHELRTPLNSIIGFTGIILQGLAGPLNAEQSKQLGMVRASARHLLALVNDVLDISKIEAGQLEVARAPFDLRQSIDRVVALVQPQAAAKRLALRVELAPALGAAVSDQRRFEQILLNLLSNAIKFTDQGAITLTAELAADFQRAGAPAQPAVRLRVADTGMGIKPEDLPTLFQPFRQVDAGLARGHDGTGLGLAICRRLAELMGGAIRAESDWGKGSTFIVTLPLRGLVKHEGEHPAH